MPRKSNTAERRQQIVAALLAVMAEQGYEKASIQAIGKQAGLAPGLIHYHFRNKEEILLELVQTLARVAQARFEHLARADAPPDERLHAWLDARLGTGDGADAQAVAAWVMIGAEAVRQPQVRQAYQQVLAAESNQLGALLADCLASHGKSRAQAANLVASLLAFMEGAFQLSSAARELMPGSWAAGMAKTLVERFIDGEPAAPASEDAA